MTIPYNPLLKPPLGMPLDKGHPLSKGLVGYWLMNGGAGNTVQDLSGNGNTGTFAGTSPSWTSGKFGNAVLLPGTDEYIDCGDPSSLEIDGDISISICIKPNDVSGLQTIIGKIKIGDGTEKEWGLSSYDGVIWWQLSAGAGLTRLTGTTMVAGSWYRIVGIRRGSTCKLYVNGGLDDTDTLAGDINPTYNCFIGRRGSAAADFFNGIVDHAIIYNRALSESEIAQLEREPFCMFRDPSELAILGGYVLTNLEVNVYDGITSTESLSTQLPLYEVSVSESVGVSENVTVSAGNWIEVSSSNVDSLCGEEASYTLEDALDGTNFWRHDAEETHWFILDLGDSYTITKVRGRSSSSYDPIDVNIYVSDDKEDWGDAVKEEITTWQDTSDWVEIETTEKSGRYIKVEIISTEVASSIRWGNVITPFVILDVCGELTNDLEVSEDDDVIITESITAQLPLYIEETADSISLTESVTASMPLLLASVYDGIGAAESISASIDLYVSVADTVGVTEDVTEILPLYIVDINDTIGVSESMTPQLPLYEVSALDSVSLSESVTALLPLYEVIEYEAIAVSEYSNAEIKSEISLFEAIGVSELITVLAISLWSNVAENNTAAWTNVTEDNSCTWTNATENNSCDWSNE